MHVYKSIKKIQNKNHGIYFLIQNIFFLHSYSIQQGSSNFPSKSFDQSCLINLFKIKVTRDTGLRQYESTETKLCSKLWDKLAAAGVAANGFNYFHKFTSCSCIHSPVSNIVSANEILFLCFSFFSSQHLSNYYLPYKGKVFFVMIM